MAYVIVFHFNFLFYIRELVLEYKPFFFLKEAMSFIGCRFFVGFMLSLLL